MGTYEELKAAIQQVIRTNGNNEITGASLQQTLLSIVNSVGANAAFAGIATPNTNPGTADQNVFYLATEPGTYANFGGIKIAEGEAVILSNKTGNWVKTISGFVTQQQLQKKYATILVNMTIVENYTNGAVSLNASLPNGRGFIYHNTGYVVVDEETETIFNYDTGIYVIYYDVTEAAFAMSEYSNVPYGSVILDIFYAYQGSVGRFSWTSSFITKTGVSDRSKETSGFLSEKIVDDKIAEKIAELDKEKIFPYSAKIFMRVGCIGDSYTSGHIQLQGESAIGSNPNYAWPHYMEGLTNNKWDNWGISGSTAKWWVSVDSSPLYTKIKTEGNKCQAYVIGLMINDQGDWSSYATPVGTISDIGTNADTYYAWYYKLIQEIISVNDKAKIFCNTCPKYASDYAYNIAVRDIVLYCRNNGQNVFLCDLASEEYNNERFYKNNIFESDYVNGHYTALGYEYMAECYLKILSDVINANIGNFQNVFQIPYDFV